MTKQSSFVDGGWIASRSLPSGAARDPLARTENRRERAPLTPVDSCRVRSGMEHCHVGRQRRYRAARHRLRRRRARAEQHRCRFWSTRRGRRSTASTPSRPSRTCSVPMAGAACGATASTTICTITRRSTRRSASRAAMPASASAATSGQEFEITAGDVAILPAGTGHQCLSASDDFCVIGAYPPGPKMQVTRPTPENHRKALKTIPKVKLPNSRSGDGQERRADEVVGVVVTASFGMAEAQTGIAIVRARFRIRARRPE